MGDRDEARRFVRRKRIFYTILVVYGALSLLWFLIDVLAGSNDWWFYWPMLGVGIGVLFIGLIMFGIGGLFGPEWESREVEKFVKRHDRDSGDTPR
jgi:hypothetical protein